MKHRQRVVSFLPPHKKEAWVLLNEWADLVERRQSDIRAVLMAATIIAAHTIKHSVIPRSQAKALHATHDYLEFSYRTIGTIGRRRKNITNRNRGGRHAR